MALIQIIDDDTYVCKQLEDFLRRKGYRVQSAYTANSGLKAIKKSRVDFVLCDYRLPDADGEEVFARIRKLDPRLPVVFMTAYADVRTAVKMIRAGARDYIVKPLLPEEIYKLIQKGTRPATESQAVFEKSFVKGKGSAIQNVLNHVDLVAPTDLCILIEGETGSGKEFIARAIHYASPRKNKAFVALDCGALPGELANSELFGHVKGAFTGAIQDKAGCFETAQGGTLFLDEIGNLSNENQMKLLRTLQEKTISRLGDNKIIGVDVRIIVATNDDLKKDVVENRFREDLYHRVNGFKISLPPIRERKEDILEFVRHFMDNANLDFDKNVDTLDDQVTEIFMKYPWPGNIRELENVIKRCVLLTKGKTITADTLPDEIRYAGYTSDAEYNISRPGKILSLRQAAMAAESAAIMHALKETGFNKSKAAEMLRVDRKTLYNKMKEYGIRAGYQK
ncbi:MAG: sigma-54-dependent Fis family transcriptional regulator [Bacteroidia bacterium]|nr:MAG: sigma-54-dependent Fis family transcriptional regulator [Bacteroidia bacterium]